MAKGPVIVITGTPGTGKSIHAEILASQSPIPLKHINIGEYVKERELYEEYSEEWQSYVVDEDRVYFPLKLAIVGSYFPQLLDELEVIVADGGVILDWHTCEPFPERWADLVVVLRCDHTKLWERLEKRLINSCFKNFPTHEKFLEVIH